MTTTFKWKLMAAAGILLIACTAQKQVVAYELPEQMLPHVKVEYVKICDRGQVLYDLNCGGCHNAKKGRKVIRPDFKPEQLTGYTLRVSNARHESAMPDSLVSEEELGVIMTFLSYKRKNTEEAQAKK